MARQHVRGGVCTLTASAVSTCTVSMSGCAAAICWSSSVRRPPTMTVLPLSRSRRASAKPIPLVEPGMKMVLPVIFMRSILCLVLPW